MNRGRTHSAAALAPRLALLAGLALLTLLLAAPRPAAARPFETGISGIGDYSPLSFERAHQTGSRWVRLALYWDSVAPRHQPASWDPTNPADPNYDWSYIDQGIVESVRQGLNPVILVDGAPRWAQRCTTPSGLQDTNLCDPDPAALAAFATAAARRYSGSFGTLPRVQYWGAINEPNLTLFFYPQFNTAGKPISPALYRTLINSFYGAIKSVNPDNLVLGGGLGPTELRGYNIGPLKFTRKLLCMKGSKNPKPTRGNCGGGVSFDIFDMHPYTTGGPDHEGRPNDVQLGDLPKLQKLLRAAAKSGRINGKFRFAPLWVTEFSWDSNPPDPGGLPMNILTQWAAQAMHRAWSSGVTHFFWYSLRDSPRRSDVPDSITVQSGLYFRGSTVAADQPKEVLYTFRFPFTAIPRKKGLEVWGRTPPSTDGKVLIQVRRHGKWRRVATVNADKGGVFNKVVKSRYGRNKRGAVRAWYSDHSSVPFPMKRVGDFRHAPFG